MLVRRKQGPTVGMLQLVKCDTSSVGGEGRGTKSMPSVEILLCGVTGETLLPAHFPPYWALLEGRVRWVRPSLVREDSEGWKRQSWPEVSSRGRGAGSASSITGIRKGDA